MAIILKGTYVIRLKGTYGYHTKRDLWLSD